MWNDFLDGRCLKGESRGSGARPSGARYCSDTPSSAEKGKELICLVPQAFCRLENVFALCVALNALSSHRREARGQPST
jgi:hypothetical protein